MKDRKAKFAVCELELNDVLPKLKAARKIVETSKKTLDELSEEFNESSEKKTVADIEYLAIKEFDGKLV